LEVLGLGGHLLLGLVRFRVGGWVHGRGRIWGELSIWGCNEFGNEDGEGAPEVQGGGVWGGAGFVHGGAERSDAAEPPNRAAQQPRSVPPQAAAVQAGRGGVQRRAGARRQARRRAHAARADAGGHERLPLRPVRRQPPAGSQPELRGLPQLAVAPENPDGLGAHPRGGERNAPGLPHAPPLATQAARSRRASQTRRLGGHPQAQGPHRRGLLALEQPGRRHQQRRGGRGRGAPVPVPALQLRPQQFPSCVRQQTISRFLFTSSTVV
jgi:hypothetical protein